MYLDAWGGEIWNLKLDTDGRLPLLVFSLDARQAEVGSHQVLLSTLSGRKLWISVHATQWSANVGPIWPWWRVMASAHREGLDWPDDLAVLGHPLDAAHCSFEFGRVCVRWHWNVDLHVVGRGTSFELAFRLGRETSRSSLTRQSTWAGHWSGA